MVPGVNDFRLTFIYSYRSLINSHFLRFLFVFHTASILVQLPTVLTRD
jgi:hypothetical protein